MTEVYNIDFRSWTLGGQVSLWLALKPLSQVCWALMLDHTLTYLYGQICESQVCPSGVSPNIERLCFSGNRDALLDSHLSTLGEHIDALKSPTGPWPSFDPAIIFRRSMSQLEGAGCVRLNQVDSIDHRHGESFNLIYLILNTWNQVVEKMPVLEALSTSRWQLHSPEEIWNLYWSLGAIADAHLSPQLISGATA